MGKLVIGLVGVGVVLIVVSMIIRTLNLEPVGAILIFLGWIILAVNSKI